MIEYIILVAVLSCRGTHFLKASKFRDKKVLATPICIAVNGEVFYFDLTLVTFQLRKNDLYNMCCERAIVRSALLELLIFGKIFR